MRKNHFISILCSVGLLWSSTVTFAQSEDITLSHVYQQSEALIEEVELLRFALGISDYPPNPEPQKDRSPIHVYAKTLEVMLKVIWVEEMFNIPPAELGQIPVKAVLPEDVFDSLNSVLYELRRIKQQQDIGSRIHEPPFVTGKTSSEVYDNISLVSSLLDGVVGRSLSLNDVFRNTQYVEDEMNLIAAKLNVKLDTGVPAVHRRKLPKDLAEQAYLAKHKIVKLQKALRMNASIVPNLTLVRVTPTEVYDATSMLMAELVRIKHHLNIEQPREERTLPFGKYPNDVFAHMRLINMNLDKLQAKVANTWR